MLDRQLWRQLAEVVAFYQFDNGGRCGSNPIRPFTRDIRWEIS